MTPLEGQARLANDTTQQVYLSPWNSMELDSQHISNGLETASHVQGLVSHTGGNHYMDYMGNLQTSGI